LFYYSVRDEIHSALWGFYGHDTTTTVLGSRQSGGCNQTVSTVPSFSGGVIMQYELCFKMDQSASFSTGGVAMGARRQLLGDLLPTVGYTSYKHSTMKSLELGRM
jgi:hypothetical protein